MVFAFSTLRRSGGPFGDQRWTLAEWFRVYPIGYTARFLATFRIPLR